MSVIEKLAKPSHLINMNDIIREGHPTLRQVCDDVTFPLSDEEIILGEKMMQFLKNSQDPVTAEKMGLRGGVGLAAPQVTYIMHDLKMKGFPVGVTATTVEEAADEIMHALGRQ